jgi:hypothetical protein
MCKAATWLEDLYMFTFPLKSTFQLFSNNTKACERLILSIEHRSAALNQLATSHADLNFDDVQVFANSTVHSFLSIAVITLTCSISIIGKFFLLLSQHQKHSELTV